MPRSSLASLDGRCFGGEKDDYRSSKNVYKESQKVEIQVDAWRWRGASYSIEAFLISYWSFQVFMSRRSVLESKMLSVTWNMG